MDSSLQVNDDTIRDQMDSGYVATRPRFTRSRRTWNINYRNLTREDIRALDTFAEVTVQRGAQAFYYPNLLPNASFEFQENDLKLPYVPSVQICPGWFASQAIPGTLLRTYTANANSTDGNWCLCWQSLDSVSIPAAQPAAGWSSLGVIATPINAPLPCAAGDEITFAGTALVNPGSMPAGVSTVTQPIIIWNLSTGTTSQTAGTPISIAGGSATQSGIQYSFAFTAPAGAVSFTIQIAGYFTNGSGAAVAINSSAFMLWDAVGLALTNSLTKYGRLAGSSGLPVAVRFAQGKIPQFSDLGFIGGDKRFGATFALEEV